MTLEQFESYGWNKFTRVRYKLYDVLQDEICPVRSVDFSDNTVYVKYNMNPKFEDWFESDWFSFEDIEIVEENQ